MKTTKAEYESFKKEFRRLQKLFNLNDYKVVFEMSSLKKENANAQILYNTTNRTVRVIVATSHEGNDFERSAKHEVTHLLCAELSVIARGRYIQEHEIESAEEKIANVISRLDIKE
jgi:hypothetical protein